MVPLCTEGRSIAGLHPQSPRPFCTTTFSASLTNITTLLPQSRDWHLHRSDCQNTLIYAHTSSRTLPTCDISLGSLTLYQSEAGDFVELILLHSSINSSLVTLWSERSASHLGHSTPGRISPVPIEWEVWMYPEPVWALFRRDKTLPLSRTDPRSHCCTARSRYSTPTMPFWLLPGMHNSFDKPGTTS